MLKTNNAANSLNHMLSTSISDNIFDTNKHSKLVRMKRRCNQNGDYAFLSLLSIISSKTIVRCVFTDMENAYKITYIFFIFFNPEKNNVVVWLMYYFQICSSYRCRPSKFVLLH